MFAELFDRPKQTQQADPNVQLRDGHAPLGQVASKPVEPPVKQTSLLDIFDEEAKSLEASRAVLQSATRNRKQKLTGQKREQGRTANTQQQLDMLEEKLEANRERLTSHKAEKLVQRVLSTKQSAPAARPLLPQGIKQSQPAFRPWHWVAVGTLLGFVLGMAYAIGFTPTPAQLSNSGTALLPTSLFGQNVWAKAMFGAFFGAVWGIVPWMVAKQKEAILHIHADGMLRPKNSPAVYSSWS